jgi:hypothetical protein
MASFFERFCLLLWALAGAVIGFYHDEYAHEGRDARERRGF